MPLYYIYPKKTGAEGLEPSKLVLETNSLPLAYAPTLINYFVSL